MPGGFSSTVSCGARRGTQGQGALRVYQDRRADGQDCGHRNGTPKKRPLRPVGLAPVEIDLIRLHRVDIPDRVLDLVPNHLARSSYSEAPVVLLEKVFEGALRRLIRRLLAGCLLDVGYPRLTEALVHIADGYDFAAGPIHQPPEMIFAASSDADNGDTQHFVRTGRRFFRGLQSFRLEGLEPLQKTDVVINNNLEVQRDLQALSKLVDAFAPKGSKISTTGDLGDLVDQELTKAANAIDAAAQRLAKLQSKPREGYSTYELRIHDSILAAAIAVTTAIAELIKAATASQQEIVREGRGSSSKTAFYKKNNRWTEGLISAAKAVATSTNTLIETADGVISGRNSPEQLIVASNDVAASTAQLVAASRVKATFMSKSQDRLETASKAVGAACRKLVRQVQDIIAEKNRDEGEAEDYTQLSSHEFKVREMEQQVFTHPSVFHLLSTGLSRSIGLICLLSRSKSSNSRTTSPAHALAWARCARSPIRKSN